MRRLKAVLGFLFQTSPDDPIERRTYIRVRLSQLLGFFLENRRHRFGHRFATKSSSAGDHFVQHRSKRKEIGAMICCVTPHLFGRHITDCSHYNAGISDRFSRCVFRAVLFSRAVSELCQTEIQDFYAVIFGDEQVLGLKVAMDNSSFMGSRQTADDLLQLAAQRGYLMWLFRPVKGSIWAEYADDATLGPEGTRQGPCPHRPIPPDCLGKRQTVYRFGVPGHGHKLDS